MPTHPNRKNLRLSTFNYNAEAFYFITICTHEKKCLFSRILPIVQGDVPSIELTQAGQIVLNFLSEIPNRFSGVTVPEFIIMPNHIHLIVSIPANMQAFNKSALSKVISYYKMNTTKQIHQLCPDIPVWQRSYYDHIIRNDADYITKVNYIRTNPWRWLEKQSSQH